MCVVAETTPKPCARAGLFGTRPGHRSLYTEFEGASAHRGPAIGPTRDVTSLARTVAVQASLLGLQHQVGYPPETWPGTAALAPLPVLRHPRAAQPLGNFY